MKKRLMKKSPFRVFILFSLSLLIGCQARPSQIVGEPLESPTHTAVAKLTQTISEQSSIPTATGTPIPSPVPNPSATSEPSRVQKDCYSLLPDFPQSANPHGVLILEYLFQYEFLDWESGNQTEIGPQQGYDDMQVSPDHKKIAYHDTLNNQIVVMTGANQILRRIPWEKNWINLSRWQNDEKLLIQTKEVLPSDAPSPPMVLVILDTGTGQSIKTNPDYPHIVQGYPSPWSSGHTVFDPTLTRVVYAQAIGENENYALWDIAGERELIALKAWPFEEPVWSPDGSTFIVYTLNGLTLVSRDGIILDTIELQEIIYTGSDAGYPVRNFSYSPDGSRVAFWVQVNGSVGKAGSYHLMILDTNTGNIVDPCLESENTQPGIVWFPNGGKIAAGVNYRASSDTWDVVIADVEQKYTVKIAEKLFPIGWLVMMP
jgi:hypothetical protein